MKTLYISILLLISGLAFGQDFEKVYSDTGDDITIRTISDNESMGIIAAGRFNFNGLILRIDTDGEVLWEKSFKIPEADSLYRYDLTDVVSTWDSNFLITGSFVNPSTLKSELLIIKIDPAGTMLWHKVFADGAPESHVTMQASNTSDSNYLVVSASSASSIVGIGFNAIKLTPSGNVLWSQSYQTNESTSIVAMEALSDSSFAIAGTIGNDGYISALTENGDLLWTKMYSNRFFKDLIVTDQNIVVYGLDAAQSSAGFLGFANKSGNLNLCKRITELGHNTFDPASLVALKDSSLCIFENSIPAPARLTHFNKAGVLLNHYSTSMYADDLMPTTNGGVLMVGNGPTNGLKASYDAIVGLVRMDSIIQPSNCLFQASLPDITVTCPTAITTAFNIVGASVERNYTIVENSTNILWETNCVDATSNINELENDFVQVYPNISDGVFHFVSASLESMNITILNSIGQIIYEENGVNSEVTIDLSEFSNGAYYYQVTTNQGGASSGLLLLQK